MRGMNRNNLCNYKGLQLFNQMGTIIAVIFSCTEWWEGTVIPNSNICLSCLGNVKWEISASKMKLPHSGIQSCVQIQIWHAHFSSVRSFKFNLSWDMRQSICVKSSLPLMQRRSFRLQIVNILQYQWKFGAIHPFLPRLDEYGSHF